VNKFKKGGIFFKNYNSLTVEILGKIRKKEKKKEKKGDQSEIIIDTTKTRVGLRVDLFICTTMTQ
jgi:hypothetical protein